MAESLIDVAQLVQYFEASEDASYDARQNAERDRDYVDGVQYTAEELAAFAKRKQPPIIINRIKRKIDFLKGYEQSQRISPRALPRTPQHEQDADGCEQALRYVADDQRFDHKRSRVWDNLLVEGMGGYRIGVAQASNGEIEIQIDSVPWDRMFYDPHSSAPDFSDAAYVGVVRWIDKDEALAEYPDAKDIIEYTITSASKSETYDDKPKHRLWADAKRKRVRICQIWIKKQDQFHYAEFTKGGILKSGPSPYVNDKGESDCELIFGSSYINRDNDRYGIVREMIGPQDEINKRRSKALHLLNTNQVVAEQGAVRDVEKARREMARPDGWIEISPGYTDKINIQTRLDLANSHMSLLQEAKNEIDMMAGNIALQGNAATSAASGKAIIASQQGGAMEIAPILDALRDLDIRVFRAVWNRIRQFWNQEKWVRVTDDERNIKWLGLNVDPMQVQMLAMQNPQMSDKIAGAVANIAQLDVDIIIDDAPDGITPQLEQFQSLVELKKMDANGELPFRAIVASMPNLKNKDQVLAAMDQAQQKPDPMAIEAQQIGLQLQAAKTQADIYNTNASGALKEAQTQRTLMEAQLAPEKVINDRFKQMTPPQISAQPQGF